MSLLNPSVALPLSRRKAASLTETLRGHAQRTWRVLEQLGQRRAAPALRQVATRLQQDQPELASHLQQTAREWSAH